MADPSVLAGLRDIHLPHPVSAWPPGPGYYVILGILVLILFLYLIREHHQRITAPKREALSELSQLEAQYLHHPEPQITAASISNLLRRTALMYHPRADVASLHDDAWLLFLNQTSHNINFEAIRNTLLTTPFNPAANDDLTPLFMSARHWIKQRGKICLN